MGTISLELMTDELQKTVRDLERLREEKFKKGVSANNGMPEIYRIEGGIRVLREFETMLQEL